MYRKMIFVLLFSILAANSQIVFIQDHTALVGFPITYKAIVSNCCACPAGEVVNLIFQWSYKSPSTGAWQNDYSNSGSDSYRIQNPTMSMRGMLILCTVRAKDKYSNDCGNPTLSNEIMVFPMCSTTTIITQPINHNVVSPATSIFSIVATGSPTLNYQWYKNNSIIPNATSNSYTTSATTINDNGAKFYCKIINPCNDSTFSDTVILTVTTQTSLKVLPSILSMQPYIVAAQSFTYTISQTEDVSYQVFDLHGKVVFAKKIVSQPPGNYSFELGNIPQGYNVFVFKAGSFIGKSTFLHLTKQ